MIATVPIESNMTIIAEAADRVISSGRPAYPNTAPGQSPEGFFFKKTAVIVERGYGKCSPPTLCRWKQRLASYTDGTQVKCLALHRPRVGGSRDFQANSSREQPD